MRERADAEREGIQFGCHVNYGAMLGDLSSKSSAIILSVGELSRPEMESVIQWLNQAGYTRRHQQDGHGFGDHLEEWERGTQLARLVRDRGQWFLDVGHTGWNDWFDVDLTAFVIDARADSVVDRLAAASEANLEHLLPALQEARRKQSEDLLGRLPPRHPYE